MKKLFLLAISVFMLISCSNNEDVEVEQTQTSIIGKWKLVSGKDSTGKDVVLSSCDLNNYFEYLENNDCNTMLSYLNNGQCISESKNGTYTFIDNILTYKKDNLYETRTRISELKASSLKYTQYYIGERGNGIWNVEEIPANEQITYTMERIK